MDNNIKILLIEDSDVQRELGVIRFESLGLKNVDPLGQEGKGLLCSKYHFNELLFNSSGYSVTARKNRNPELIGMIV